MFRPIRVFDNPPNRAWEIDFSEDAKTVADWDATVAMWLIHAPGQSPVWNRYVVSCVHLRDIPGQSKPAKKTFSAATHEIMIIACNPDMGDVAVEGFRRRQDELRAEGKGWFLTPFNYVGQFEIAEDMTAKDLTALLVRSIVDNHLPAEPPLSGGDYWTISLAKTLEHLTTGSHRSPFSSGQGKTQSS
jgi:hypothetical protein